MSDKRQSNGVVVAVRDGVAEVQLAASSTCGGCRANSVCGGARTVQLAVAPGTAVGSSLSIGMAASDINLAVLVAYLLPAVTLLFGAVFLSPWGDAFAALGATFGLALGLVVMRLLQRHVFADRLIPTVTACAPGKVSQPAVHSSHSITGEAP